ncbi:MAG: hypothetical protein V1662_05860 [Candidatus Omnitrophota bacterium]
MNKKLAKIMRRNAEEARRTPYNFCDRWCERCALETQKGCSLYLELLEQRLINIAYGKDENDLEIVQAELEKRLQEIEDTAEIYTEEDNYISNEDFDSDEELRSKEVLLYSHPLQKTVEQYMKQANAFLKSFLNQEEGGNNSSADYETVCWYHTLLPAKMYRALCGLCLYEKDKDDDFELCDAVAQLCVCKKAVSLSIQALKRIAAQQNHLRKTISLLVVLLYNIFSRMEIVEQEL